MDLKDTQSEKNLRAALTGESLARNRYTFFAMKARKEGHGDIAQAFERMAKNEMMHAKLWYEFLNGTQAATADCLQDAMKGEFSEWHDMYPAFAAQARADGLEPLARMFESVAEIERDHEKQFMTLYTALMRAGEPAPAGEKTAVHRVDGYRCQFCGAVYEKRPDVCGVCGAIGAFDACSFERP